LFIFCIFIIVFYIYLFGCKFEVWRKKTHLIYLFILIFMYF
jgi:hypothetical protein